MKQSSEFRVQSSGLKEKSPQFAIRLCPRFRVRSARAGYNPQWNGFTLLEVMIAVAILAIVLVSLLGLKSRSTRNVMLSEHITTATLLAKRTMTETLLTKPLVPIEEEGEYEEEQFVDYTWRKIIAPTPIQNLLEVRVAVVWKEGERQEMVELVSYE